MKKITFLLVLLTVALGYSQTFPLDFSSVADAFTWDPSDPSIAGSAQITSGQLEIIGNGNNWDNAFIAFSGGDVVDLSNNAANTITFTMQSTTAPADEVHTHRIKLSTTTGNFETDFTTVGPDEKTVFIDAPAGLGDLTELRIFVDRNSADTGTYLVDNIDLFVDATAPTAFTATVGTIGAFGVELLLNATDNSGTIIYDISYNGGANTVQTTGASGVETSFTVPGLTPDTAYSFEVSASDGTGNTAANNPITGLNATTTVDTSNACAGQTADYAYTFETLPSGTEVRVTIEILNTVNGLVAQFFNDGNGNQNPTPVSGTPQKFEYTFPSLANGQVIPFTAGFAWAAGGALSVSRSYTVGDNCATTPPGEDVTLSDLQIDGTTIAGFTPSTTTYNIGLPDASSTPVVTLVTPTNTNAVVGTITQASGVPGSATFDVTSEDTNIVETYTINFSVQLPLTELIGNAGFEAGDFTDWDFIGSGQTIITTNPSEGTYAANINNMVPMSSIGIKSSNRGIGIVNPGDQVTVKFDARGSFDTGGVFNAELFSEISGGGATNQILSPIVLDADPDTWKSFEFTVNLGGNVGQGISLLFSAVTGGGNSANIFIDNVSVVNNDQVLSTKDFKIAGLKVYPNPASDSWTVKTQNIKMSSIQIFDILGKQVLLLKPEATEATINASQLKSGLYFAKINTAAGLSSLKLVKQ